MKTIKCKAGIDTEYACVVIRANFQLYLDNIKNARITKNESFHKTDKKRILRLIHSAYSLLNRYLDQNETIDEEYDLLLRSIDIMTAQQFLALVELIYQDYISLKIEEVE